MAPRLLGLLLLVGAAHAYPQFWAQEFNEGNCNALPTKPQACHKAPVTDTETSITVTDATGKAVTSACAGKAYTVSVKFPEARLSYLTLSGGAVAKLNSLNQKCRNTFTFGKPTGFSPTTSVSAPATAPASGSNWEVGVASAKGGCAHFMLTKASLPLAKC